MPTESISQDVIYDALYSALAITDSVLQIWLTLTFAVIVSTYVAGKRFDQLMYRLVSGLYTDHNRDRVRHHRKTGSLAGA